LFWHNEEDVEKKREMKDENSRLNFIIFMGKIVLRYLPKIGYSKQSNPDV